MTRQDPSTQWISLRQALEHVSTHEGSRALAERLLVQALAAGLPAQGYVVHAWPPYREGWEALSGELFADYGAQVGRARIDWAEGSAVMPDGHPHFACCVLAIEVSKQNLLARWPGRLKGAGKTRRPSIRRLVAAAEKAGAKSVTVEGVTMTLGGEQAAPTNELDEWIAKHARTSEGH